jgi:hypothetical protein
MFSKPCLLFGMALAVSILAINAPTCASPSLPVGSFFSAAPNSYWLFDFQGDPNQANPSHIGDDGPGATIITEFTLYSAGQGYGLLTTAEVARNRGGTDLFLKDFIFEESGEEMKFRVDMPNGLYGVRTWQGDMDFARQGLRMIVSLDGGVTEAILYGSNGENPSSPRPGTFMTTFVDSGTPGVFGVTIPDGKQASFANYRMEASEFLQVHDAIEVVDGSLTFMVGSHDRMINAVEIVALDSCENRIAFGLVVPGDTNDDCQVNMVDFAALALDWMACNDPEDPSCTFP